MEPPESHLDPPLKCAPNHLLRTEQYWPLQVIQLSEILIERPLPGKFAHLNQLFIRSFDCMVLRSFHTPSRYDFRSNVIRPCTSCQSYPFTSQIDTSIYLTVAPENLSPGFSRK